MEDGELALQVANAAMAEMESHEKLCGERYRQIIENQQRGDTDRRELKVALDSGQEKLRLQISSGHALIHSRMWTMMFSMLMTVVCAAGTLGLILLAYIQSRGQ